MPIFQRLLAWDRHAMRFYRLEDRLLRRDHSDLAFGVSALSRLLTGVEVDREPSWPPASRSCTAMAPASAAGPRWAMGTTIFHHLTIGRGARLPAEEDGYPTIERGVYIYPGSILIGPISVGDGAKITASAVVSKDVAPGAIVSGNPRGASSAGSRAAARRTDGVSPVEAVVRLWAVQPSARRRARRRAMPIPVAGQSESVDRHLATAVLLDEAFNTVSALDFEIPNPFVNHAPMACQALAELGFDAAINQWVKHFDAAGHGATRPVTPTWGSAFSWQDKFGNLWLLPEWMGYFERALEDNGWQNVVQTWLPRLMPG